MKVLIFLYPKCSKTHLRESLIPKFSGDYTLDPIKGKEGEGKKEDGREGREGDVWCMLNQ